MLDWTPETAQQYLPFEIEDACRLNAADTKWGVDGHALVLALKALSPAEADGVAKGVRRFWDEETPGDLREAVMRSFKGWIRE